MSKKPKRTSGDLVTVLRARAQRWLGLSNVTSVGVGYRVKGGKKTRQLCIQVTVSRKLSTDRLREEGLPPLPASIKAPDGKRYPVDVLERNYRPSYSLVNHPVGSSLAVAHFSDPRMTRRSRLVEVMPGVSVGHERGMAGTLGAIVFDNRTGLPCALSNAHVLRAPDGQPGECVVQPGMSDDGAVRSNQLGVLVREHIGLAGDCAIASIQQRLYREAIFELGVTPRRVARVELDDLVIKSGRTTGVTRGKVVRVGVVVNHDYGPPIGVRAVGGFEIGPIADASPTTGQGVSSGGDSGSLWLIYENSKATDIAAGLHFAEQTDVFTDEPHALACNIHSVLEKLDVSFGPRI